MPDPRGSAPPMLHPVYRDLPTTVFEVMSGLARQYGALNLGQGFPDDPPPAELAAALARATHTRSQHYPPMAGVPELRAAVAGFYDREQGLALDPGQVIVTSGATEALAAAIMALVGSGDDVVLFQPAYDAYAPLVRRAGGVPVMVPLYPPGWRHDHAALAAAITPRTRALVINDPLNPAGSVATPADLAALAALAIAHDLVVIADEVWETVRFDGVVHQSLLAQPGMAGRTVKIGSAGKIFGATGWKVGWLVAEVGLAAGIARAHQFLTFTTPPMLQYAVAEGLNDPALARRQQEAWAASRAALFDAAAQTGLVLLPNAATWFACLDLAASGIALDDQTFAHRLVAEAGVATIPLSALWEGPDAPTGVARLCHCKPAAMLREGIERIARWRDQQA